jgi:hypothetical protein
MSVFWKWSRVNGGLRIEGIPTAKVNIDFGAFAASMMWMFEVSRNPLLSARLTINGLLVCHVETDLHIAAALVRNVDLSLHLVAADDG